MDKEAAPIIKTLKLHEISKPFQTLPMQAYAGKVQNTNVYLILNGEDPVNKVPNIGSQASTLSTFLGVEHFHPDLIISVGSAGGIEKNGAQLKDIYVSQKIDFFDRRIGVTKNFENYGIGNYVSFPLNDSFIQKEKLKKASFALAIHLIMTQPITT